MVWEDKPRQRRLGPRRKSAPIFILISNGCATDGHPSRRGRSELAQSDQALRAVRRDKAGVRVPQARQARRWLAGVLQVPPRGDRSRALPKTTWRTETIAGLRREPR